MPILVALDFAQACHVIGCLHVTQSIVHFGAIFFDREDNFWKSFVFVLEKNF